MIVQFSSREEKSVPKAAIEWSLVCYVLVSRPVQQNSFQLPCNL